MSTQRWLSTCLKPLVPGLGPLITTAILIIPLDNSARVYKTPVQFCSSLRSSTFRFVSETKLLINVASVAMVCRRIIAVNPKWHGVGISIPPFRADDVIASDISM